MQLSIIWVLPDNAAFLGATVKAENPEKAITKVWWNWNALKKHQETRNSPWSTIQIEKLKCFSQVHYAGRHAGVRQSFFFFFTETACVSHILRLITAQKLHKVTEDSHNGLVSSPFLGVSVAFVTVDHHPSTKTGARPWDPRRSSRLAYIIFIRQTPVCSYSKCFLYIK